MASNRAISAPDAPLVIGAARPARPRRHSERISRGSHAGLPRRRPTDRARHMTFEQVANLLNAAYSARASGAPLIVSFTIVWAHFPGFAEEKLSTMTTRLFDSVS